MSVEFARYNEVHIHQGDRLVNPAVSWKTARRVVAKVDYHCGELFPRVRLIATNLEADSGAKE